MPQYLKTDSPWQLERAIKERSKELNGTHEILSPTRA